MLRVIWEVELEYYPNCAIVGRFAESPTGFTLKNENRFGNNKLKNKRIAQFRIKILDCIAKYTKLTIVLMFYL